MLKTEAYLATRLVLLLMPVVIYEKGCLCSRHEFHCQIDRCEHAVGSRDSLAGNFKCCAVIGTGARKWEAQRDVHTFVKGMQLQWDQSLIVIHAKHRVEVALNRAMEHCVGRVGTSKNCGLPSEAGLAVFADSG